MSQHIGETIKGVIRTVTDRNFLVFSEEDSVTRQISRYNLEDVVDMGPKMAPEFANVQAGQQVIYQQDPKGKVYEFSIVSNK